MPSSKQANLNMNLQSRYLMYYIRGCTISIKAKLFSSKWRLAKKVGNSLYSRRSTAVVGSRRFLRPYFLWPLAPYASRALGTLKHEEKLKFGSMISARIFSWEHKTARYARYHRRMELEFSEKYKVENTTTRKTQCVSTSKAEQKCLYEKICFFLNITQPHQRNLKLQMRSVFLSHFTWHSVFIWLFCAWKKVSSCFSSTTICSRASSTRSGRCVCKSCSMTKSFLPPKTVSGRGRLNFGVRQGQNLMSLLH